MSDNENPAGAPKSGTAEAEAFVAALEARVQATETKIAEDFISLEEAESFSLKSGLSALTTQLRKENGDDLIYTKKPESPKKKRTKKKRMRMSI